MTTKTNAEEIKLLFEVIEAVCSKAFDITGSEWHPINDNLNKLDVLIAKNRKLLEAKPPVGSSDECMREMVKILEHTRCDNCEHGGIEGGLLSRCDDCCRLLVIRVNELSNKWWVSDRKSKK